MNETTTQTTAPNTIAAIDIGSNAIRMVIAQIDGEGRVETIEDLERAMPLGLDSFAKGRIETETINQAIEVLRGYQRAMEPYGVRNLRAVATSAVREAANQDLFTERVFMATGINVEVISGAEEDRLIYAAVRDAFEAEGLNADQESLIVELGSGSAEVSKFRRGEVVFSGSYPIGAIRLRNSVGAAHRSADESVGLMRHFVNSTLDVIEQSCDLDTIRNFILVSGEARFAAEHIAENGREGARVRAMKRGDFLRFARRMSRIRPEEIARRHGLPFQDCEALGPAMITAAEMLKRTPARRVLSPAVTMRDGLILDLIAEETGRGLEEIERQAFASAEHIARRYQADERHARHVADLSWRLFDYLTKEHGLGRRERRLLRVAALLHDVGIFISNRSHHKHTEYIVAASDIFGVRADDRQVVACIGRYHRRSLPKPTHPLFMSLTRDQRATVSKLAAILRVADALDRSHSRKVADFAIELTAKEMTILARTREDLTLERLAMRVKGDMFEEVFGKRVLIQNA